MRTTCCLRVKIVGAGPFSCAASGHHALARGRGGWVEILKRMVGCCALRKCTKGKERCGRQVTFDKSSALLSSLAGSARLGQLLGLRPLPDRFALESRRSFSVAFSVCGSVMQGRRAIWPRSPQRPARHDQCRCNVSSMPSLCFVYFAHTLQPELLVSWLPSTHTHALPPDTSYGFT